MLRLLTNKAFFLQAPLKKPVLKTPRYILFQNIKRVPLVSAEGKPLAISNMYYKAECDRYQEYSGFGEVIPR